MRILQVSPYYRSHLGGVEVMVDELSRRVSELGHDVDWMASMGDAGSPNRTTPVMNWNGLEKYWGVPYPLWAPWEIGKLCRAIKRCDVVHLHDTLSLGSTAIFKLARLVGKPVVLTQHIAEIPIANPLSHGAFHLVTRLLGWPIIRRADELAVCSAVVAAYCAELGSQPHLIPNGLSARFFHPVSQAKRAELRRSLALPKRRPVLLFVGRFVEKKGLAHLRRAAAELPEAQWIIIGQGWIDPKQWGLANVRCLGALDHRRLADYYRAADLTVLPSIGEGFPLVIQESLGCGTPVVTSSENIDAYPFVGEVAFSVSDRRRLGEAIRHALADPEALSQRRRQASAFARAHWCWRSTAARYVALYESAIEKGRHAARCQ